MSTNINHKLTVQKWHNLYEWLKTIKNPDANVLQQFLKAHYKKTYTSSYHHLYMHALQLKQEALTKEPSPIEKTMTRSQLYLTDNPLWTNNMRPKDIIDVLSTIQWLKEHSQQDHTSYIFDKVIDFNGDVNRTLIKELYR